MAYSVIDFDQGSEHGRSVYWSSTEVSWQWAKHLRKFVLIPFSKMLDNSIFWETQWLVSIMNPETEYQYPKEENISRLGYRQSGTFGWGFKF